MGKAEPRGEPCADGGSEARERSADQAPAAPAAPEPLSGEVLRPAEGTRCEKTHMQDLDPEPNIRRDGGIRGMSDQSMP